MESSLSPLKVGCNREEESFFKLSNQFPNNTTQVLCLYEPRHSNLSLPSLQTDKDSPQYSSAPQ